MTDAEFFKKNFIKLGGKPLSYELWRSDFSLKIQFEYSDYAEGNLLELNDFIGAGTLSIKINGKDNSFFIGERNLINRELMVSFLGTTSIPIPENIKIGIGCNNIFNGNVYINAPEAGEHMISIGDDNLFANRVLFMGPQNHGIFDIKTGKLINVYKDIKIGNHNWFCKDVELFPGAEVSNNCVVAAHSVVNKVFLTENCLLAGIPAKIKREEICWDIRTELENNNMY